MQASPAFVEAFSKCLTLISTNEMPQCDATLRPFFASTAPNISMTDYLQRTRGEGIARRDEILCGTGLLVSIKFYSDTFYSNSYFASVGGVSTSEMNALERLMLKTLAFDLTVKPEEFHFVFSEILDGEHLRLPLVFPKTSNSARLWTLEQVEADLAAQNGLRFSRPAGTTAVAVEQPQHHKEKVSHQRNSTKASSQELITGYHSWVSKRKDVSEIETHRAGGAADAERRHIVAHKTDHLMSRHAHSRPGKQADNGDEIERESSENIDHTGVEETRGGAGDNPSLARQVLTRRRAGGNPTLQSTDTNTASARYAHATEGSSFGSPEEEHDLSRSVREVSTPRSSSYQESTNQRGEATSSPGMGWSSDASSSSSSSSSPISGEGVFAPPKFASLFCPTLPSVNPVTPISGFWTNVDSPRAASYHMGVGKGRRSTSNSYEAFRPSESPKPNFGRPSPALSMARRNGPARHHHHSTLQPNHTYQGQIQSRSTSTARHEHHPTTTASCTSPTASSSTPSTMAPYSAISPSNVIFRSAPRNEDAAHQPRQEDGATSFRAHSAAAAASVFSHDNTVTDLAMLAFQPSSGSPSACVSDSQYRWTCSLCQAAALCSSASVSGYGNGSSAPSPASHLLPHQHAHNHHQQLQQQSGGPTYAPMGLPPFSPRLLDCPIRTAQSPTDISDMESSEEEEFAYTGLSRSLSHPNIKFHSSSPVASLGSPGYFHYDEEDEDRDILSDEQVEVEEDVMRRTIDHPTSSRELGDDSPFQSPATPSGVASHSWAPRSFFMSPSTIHSPNMSSSGQHPCSLQAGQNLATRPEDYDPQTQPQSPAFDRPATQTPREDSSISSTGPRSRSRRPSANTNSLAVSASSVAVDLLSSSDNVSQCSNTDSDNETDDDANVDADVDLIDDCGEVNDDELSFQGDSDFEDPTTERSSRLVSSHYRDTSDIFAALSQPNSKSAMLTTPSRTVSSRTNPRGGNTVPSSGKSSWSRAWNSRALSHRDRFSEPEPRRTTTFVEIEDVFSGVSHQPTDESSSGHTAVFVSTSTFRSFTSPRRHLSLGYDNFYTPRPSNMVIEALQKPAREEACSVPITLSTN